MDSFISLENASLAASRTPLRKFLRKLVFKTNALHQIVSVFKYCEKSLLVLITDHQAEVAHNFNT